MKEAVQSGGISASGGTGSTVLPGGPVVRHGVYAWAVVGLLWLVCFFSYADRQALFSVFPVLRKEMGLTSVQLGMLGSSFAVIMG